jgi:Cu+-exporting ATPase
LVSIGDKTDRGEGRGQSCCKGGTGGDPGAFIDHVCGMSTSDPEAFIPYEYQGTTYHFCCKACLERFRKDPEKFIRRPGPSGMPSKPGAPPAGGAYTCPMHPEVMLDHPGICPFCGMSLEPVAPSADAGQDPEYLDMLRRFKICLAFTAVLVAVAMGHMFRIGALDGLFHSGAARWLEFALATPVVLWGGWPFFVRARLSLKGLSFNMFTLIGFGVLVSYAYSAAAMLAPRMFPGYAGSPDGAAGLYFESSAMIVTLVLLGQVLELKARWRTGEAIRSLLALSPGYARRIDPDGTERDVPLDAVQPGDRLRVRPGEKVPTDGVIIEGTGVIDESMITGEALPVDKGPKDEVVGGTLNASGSFVMEATRVGAQTLLSSIVRITLEAARSRAPVQALADSVSRVFVPVVLAAAAATFAAWSIVGPEPRLAHAVVSAVSVLIIACPCALGLATPMAILVASGKAARMGVLFKDASAIEALSRVDTVVMDKTGTLTEGRPALTGIVAAGGTDEETMLSYAAGLAVGSEHPLSRALLDYALSRGVRPALLSSFESRPGMGVLGEVGGRMVVMGSARMIRDSGMDPGPLEEQADRLSALGESVMYLAIDKNVSAFLRFTDPLKETSREVVEMLAGRGLTLVMLTGDRREAAERTAGLLGIRDVRAGVLPAGKAHVIEELKAQGRVVAMVGDGINDAPALASADVGIAMGSGTDMALKSAIVALLKPDLRYLVRALDLSRLTMRNIAQNLFFAFFYNAVCIPVAAGLLYPVLGIVLSPVIAAAAMSLSSVSVIGNALRLGRARI